jgi:hypothetical protein
MNDAARRQMADAANACNRHLNPNPQEPTTAFVLITSFGGHAALLSNIPGDAEVVTLLLDALANYQTQGLQK